LCEGIPYEVMEWLMSLEERRVEEEGVYCGVDEVTL